MKNLPVAENLFKIAIRSHFMAWDAIIEIISDFKEFDSYYQDMGGDAKSLPDYLAVASEDFSEIYTWVAHASEIFLRAKLCEVSPFLLLANTQNSFSSSSMPIDFTDLRTVDSVDLPRLARATTSFTVTDEFVTYFNKVRKLRNKIIHLGSAELSAEIDTTLSLLVDQYKFLWGDQKWWSRRLSYEQRSRRAYFSVDWEDPEIRRVMSLVPLLRRNLTKSNFKAIFGHAKKDKAWLCSRCWYNSEIRDYDDSPGYETVYISEGEAMCILCETKSSVHFYECAACNKKTPHADGECLACL